MGRRSVAQRLPLPLATRPLAPTCSLLRQPVAPRAAAAARRGCGRRTAPRRARAPAVAQAQEVEEDLWQIPDREQWYHAKW